MSDLVFDEWVFGRARGGSRWHAVKRQRFGRRTHTLRGLCEAASGGNLRATNTGFDPSADRNVCTSCSRTWTARHAPQVPGWTKPCATCGHEKPINQFHVDRRTSDNLSKSCLDCDQAAKDTVRAAQDFVTQEAARQVHLQRARVTRERQIAALTRIQESTLTPAYACTNNHCLTPTARSAEAETALPPIRWLCPCGTIDVDVDWARVFAVVDALRVLEAAPTPEAVPVCYPPPASSAA